jgi:hypothetical protein
MAKGNSIRQRLDIGIETGTEAQVTDDKEATIDKATTDWQHCKKQVMRRRKGWQYFCK